MKLYCLDIGQLITEQQEKLIKDFLALKNSISEKENSLVEEDFV